MLKRVCGENVAVHILKVIFFGKKWRNSKIWGEIFVNLQTKNKEPERESPLQKQA